jgi:hypothetical protein
MTTTELIDLGAIKGAPYNHSGQLIRAEFPSYDDFAYYLGDDHDQHSAVDALVLDIVEQCHRIWNFESSEIVRIEQIFTDYGNNLVRVWYHHDECYDCLVDSNGNDREVKVPCGVDSYEDVEYKELDVGTIVRRG